MGMRNHGWMTLLVVMVGSFVIGIGSAQAYTVLGAKWPGGNPSVGFDSSYTTAGTAWQQRARDAMAEWAAVSGPGTWAPGAFWFREDAASGNRIQAANIATQYGCNNMCAAVTRLSRNVWGEMTWFALIMNTGSGYAFYDGTQAPSLPRNYVDLRTVLRHELGHALGLCHTNVGTGYLMSTSVQIGVAVGLDADARNGLRYLYWPNYTLTSPSGSCIGA